MYVEKREKRVCIVDDDLSLCRAMRRLLGASGFAVQFFTETEEFLQSGAYLSADCLILDVRMPGMNGVDLQKNLKARGSTVPIIFITAHDDPHIRWQTREAGATLLSKPFDQETLLQAICSATGDRKTA